MKALIPIIATTMTSTAAMISPLLPLIMDIAEKCAAVAESVGANISVEAGMSATTGTGVVSATVAILTGDSAVLGAAALTAGVVSVTGADVWMAGAISGLAVGEIVAARSGAVIVVGTGAMEADAGSIGAVAPVVFSSALIIF